MAIKKVELQYYETKQTEQGLEYEERNITVPVRALKVKQYREVSKLLGQIVEKAKNNDEIMEFIKINMGIVQEDMQDKETGELLGALRERNAGNWIETIIFLMKEIPDEVVGLVSEVANLNEALVEELEPEQLFDLIEACVEVNDISQLTKAVKNFSENLRRRFIKEEKEKQSNENLQKITK